MSAKKSLVLHSASGRRDGVEEGCGCCGCFVAIICMCLALAAMAFTAEFVSKSVKRTYQNLVQPEAVK